MWDTCPACSTAPLINLFSSSNIIMIMMIMMIKSMSFLTTTFSKHHHHLVPLPAHIEDDGALADLVGDDEEGGWRVDWSLR